jgi:hypothetical protein
MNITDTYTDASNHLRWKSNDRLVPVDCLREVAPRGYDKASHAAAVSAENDAFIAEYIRTVSYTAEQKAEIFREVGRNAVNVVTGRRIDSY